MARVGGRTPPVPGAIEPPCERLPAMGLDLFDRAEGFPANRESLWARTCEESGGAGRESGRGEQVRDAGNAKEFPWLPQCIEK